MSNYFVIHTDADGLGVKLLIDYYKIENNGILSLNYN